MDTKNDKRLTSCKNYEIKYRNNKFLLLNADKNKTLICPRGIDSPYYRRNKYFKVSIRFFFGYTNYNKIKRVFTRCTACEGFIELDGKYDEILLPEYRYNGKTDRSR